MWTLLIKESKDFFCKSSLLCDNKISSNELSYSISVTNFAPSSERISKLTIDCLGRSGPIRTWSGTLLSTAMSRTSGCLQVFSGSQTYSCTTGAEPVNDLSTGQTYLRPWVWVSWGGILCGRDSMEISCAEVFVISPLNMPNSHPAWSSEFLKTAHSILSFGKLLAYFPLGLKLHN